MDKGTIIRSAVLILALINQVLIAANLNPIPGTQDMWGEVISTAFTVITALIAWFKNNYVTAKGKGQKEVIVQAGLK